MQANNAEALSRPCTHAGGGAAELRAATIDVQGAGDRGGVPISAGRPEACGHGVSNGRVCF